MDFASLPIGAGAGLVALAALLVAAVIASVVLLQGNRIWDCAECG